LQDAHTSCARCLLKASTDSIAVDPATGDIEHLPEPSGAFGPDDDSLVFDVHPCAGVSLQIIFLNLPDEFISDVVHCLKLVHDSPDVQTF